MSCSNCGTLQAVNQVDVKAMADAVPADVTA